MTVIRQMIRLFAVLGLAASVSACVSANDPATRSMQLGTELAAAGTGAAIEAEIPAGLYRVAQYDLGAIRINVPHSLKVSEANTFKPRADIVWRGEAPGDRYAQVQAIFADAMARGTADMHKGRKVDLEIEVTKFHALTEKTRYTIGGMHEMRFILTLRDSATGEVVDGPRPVVADVKAAGGSAAIAEEAVGRTQRVVTVERLAAVIRQELSAPASEEQIVARLQASPLAGFAE